MTMPQEKILAWENKFHEFITQTVQGTDCVSNPFPILNEDENLVSLKLTGIQLRKILSSIQVGAEWAYPDQSQQILFDFWKAFACPPELSEQDCYDYPSYASFVRYLPMNPYIDPTEIPEGYETQPFVVNGEDGNDIPNYQHFDVIVPSSSLTLDINWWESISGQLPTIEVVVQGAGKVMLKMLTLPQGGLAVITLDNPPDLLDIIGGVVTSADNIIDLNQDLVSLPPETAQELIFELDVTGAGMHTIYIVFLPILDDSLIPIRFGGGFRGLTLCDFVPEANMGITALRFQACNLEQQIDGEWTVVDGWEDWLDCVPSGGGGGAALIAGDTNHIALGADETFTNTTYANGSAGNWTRQFSKANAMIGLKVSVSNSGANNTFVRPIVLNVPALTSWNGDNATEDRNAGTTSRTMVVWDVFNGLDIDTDLSLRIERKVSAGTGTIHQNNDVEWVVIEFDTLDELFVQDIRIQDGELQKKIGGVWIDVEDSFEAIWSSIQTTANNAFAAASAAAAAAAAAQATANGAVTVNNTQNTIITNHEARLDSIETVDIPQINLTLADHETRIDALEAASSEDSPYFLGGVWSREFDWIASTPTDDGWTVIDGTEVPASFGVISTNGTPKLITLNTPAFLENNVTHIGILLRHNANGFIEVTCSINGATTADVQHTSTGAGDRNFILWMRVPNTTVGGLNIALSGSGSEQFFCYGFYFLGRGVDPF